MKPSRSMRHPFEPAEHCYEEWCMAPNYTGYLYRRIEVSPAPYKYNVGEVFKPYDNSYCIDLETGKRSYITPTYCIGEESDTIFIIIEEPYYDLVKTVCGYYASHRFVTVRSSNTGKLYRVLCREVDYMDCEENLDVNNIKILENKSRSEEIKQAAQAYYPAGTLHEEKAVSAFIRGAKWADDSRPQSYSKQELMDMGFAFDLNGDIIDPKKEHDITVNYVLNRVVNYLKNADTDDYMDSGIFQWSDLINDIEKNNKTMKPQIAREEEIKKEAKNKYPYIKGLPQTVAHQEIFIEGAKWADETMIERAREWVKNIFTGFDEELANNIADEFVKAMKGE